MNYSEALQKLDNRQSRKLDNHTYLQVRNEKEIAIKLHDTDIVTMQKNGINILSTGGWKTRTTKDRMNVFGGACIQQIKRQWIIDNSLFYDGIKTRDGKIISKKNVSDKESEKLDKLIKAYCLKLKELKSLPSPNLGDCLYCSAMEVKTGNPLGEVIKDRDHLISHLKEKYMMGSLIFNALKSAGYNNPAFIFQMDIRESIVRAVKKYFRRNLGLI